MVLIGHQIPHKISCSDRASTMLLNVRNSSDRASTKVSKAVQECTEASKSDRASSIERENESN